MTLSLNIHHYNPDDAPFLIECLLALQAHEVALHDSRMPSNRQVCEDYRSEIIATAEANKGGLLLACHAGRRVGFICYWIANEDSLLETADSTRFGYISDLFVVPEQRGRGIAKRLLGEAESRLKAQEPIKRLRICTLAGNRLATSAYEAAGFQAYEITLEKKLG